MFLQLPSEQAAAQPSTDANARVPLANIKPRMRMSVLYFIANSLNYLVAGTSNRSELTIGYFTKYGDGAADILPLGRLLKSEVRHLAADLDIPPSIVDKPPSAGLWSGQTDEEEMGFSYSDLRALPERRSASRGAGAGDAHRALDSKNRTQTGPCRHARTRVATP